MPHGGTLRGGGTWFKVQRSFALQLVLALYGSKFKDGPHLGAGFQPCVAQSYNQIGTVGQAILTETMNGKT